MPIEWIPLTDAESLDALESASFSTPCLVFKHSTRCNISTIAKLRLEDDWDLDSGSVKAYYLDLLRYRPLSNALAERYDVHHESPQVLLLQNGAWVYDESHLGIRVEELKEALGLTRA